MKFIVSSGALLKQLQIVGGVLNNNNTLAILDNFLFDLDGNNLTISASDLETTISASLEVDSEDNGLAAIPARLLLDGLKALPEQPVTFVINGSNNTVEMSSDYGKYSLAFVEGDEFPKLPEMEDISTTVIPAEILATAVNKTLFAAGNDELRPVMSGVFFQFSSDNLTFVATDAHKLVRYRRNDLKSDNTAEFIMPRKPLTILKSTLASVGEEVTIHHNDTNARFEFENIILTCRLIDGKYPNYEAVIPKDNPNRMEIERGVFLSSVKRVAIFSNKTTHQVRLKMAGSELNISAEDLDFSNKAHERLSCNYQGEDMEIGFNSRFLNEMLSNLESDSVSLEMSAPNRAGIILPNDGLEDGEDILMLVMPVMLNN
ncbi:MAG TPA: DNA polymerase III subunit beta [Cryomorphaceae bacterium]|nr:DNA polymerase III subunit beta [Cryomorphaceae bacterium]